MHNMRYYIPLTLVALLSISACNKVKVDVSGQNEIRLVASTAAGVEITKAGSTAMTTPFDVYCWKTDRNIAGTVAEGVLATPILEGATATYYPSGYYTTDPVKYWQDRSYYIFSGIAGLGDGASIEYACSDAKVLSFTVTDFATGDNDFIYSDFVKDQQKTTENVALTFNHATTKVDIKVVCGTIPASVNASTATVTVTAATLQKIATKGTFNSTTGWTADTVDALDLTAASTITKYAVPHTLDTDAIKLSYQISITYNSSSTPAVYTITDKVVALKTTAISSWDAGQNVTYTLTVNPVGGEIVSFGVTVTEMSKKDKNI